MIKLDDNLLQELGLGVLPPEEKKRMLAHIYETLEMRVGMELAKQMSDAQLNEFEEFINRNDEAGALRWLETNFPNYKDVVAAEFEKLKVEIRQVAPQIVASAQQQAATMPPAGQQMQGQYASPPQPYPGGQHPQQMPGQQYGMPPQMPAQPYPPQPQYGYGQAPAAPPYPAQPAHAPAPTAGQWPPQQPAAYHQQQVSQQQPGLAQSQPQAATQDSAQQPTGQQTPAKDDLGLAA